MSLGAPLISPAIISTLAFRAPFVGGFREACNNLAESSGLVYIFGENVTRWLIRIGLEGSAHVPRSLRDLPRLVDKNSPYFCFLPAVLRGVIHAPFVIIFPWKIWYSSLFWAFSVKDCNMKSFIREAMNTVLTPFLYYPF